MTDTKSKENIIKTHIKEILNILGVPKNENTKDTPQRIAKSWLNEICKNINPQTLEHLKSQMKYFPNEAYPHKNMVMIKNITFNSGCSHHFLPFSGFINIGYIPNKKILGLSKFPRIADYFSKKPQIQEYLVKDICEFIYNITQSEYVIVSSIATHACVACRGIESNCKTITFFEKGNNTNANNNNNAQNMFNTLGGFAFK